jgi:hypothetical protein
MSLDEAGALAAINADKRSRKLYADSGQLRVAGERVQAFMTQSLRSVGALVPDLLSYYELLYALVRATDSYPLDAEYKVRVLDGVCVLDCYGNALAPPSPEAQVLEPELAQAARGSQTEASALVLDGLDSESGAPLAALLEAYASGRVNKIACAAFAAAPPGLEAPWRLAALRGFYARSGDSRWLPPIDDFLALDRRLSGQAQAQAYRDLVLRAMANAGRMGFCPTQYLRRVILPLLRRSQDDLGAFASRVSLVADCFHGLSAEMGEEGDGSASNLFTLKTLIRPLVAPESRLFLPAYAKDPSMPSLEEVLFSVGRRWAALFRKAYPFTREILRFYAETFFERVARIETPREILSQSLRLLDHVDFLTSRLPNEGEYRRFRKGLHAKGLAILLRRAESSGQNSAYLRTLTKHFDSLEALIVKAEAEAGPREPEAGRPGRSPFSQADYHRYLRFFAAGSFSSPQDIDDYFALLAGLRSLRDADADEALRFALEHAKDPEERSQLIRFLKESPAFDELIYQAWRAKPAQEAEALLQALRSGLRRYLIDPDAELAVEGLGDPGEARIEAAYVKQLVRSAQLTKVKIDEILKSSLVDGQAPLPAALKVPACFRVREKALAREEETAPRNAHLDFLKSKLALVWEAEAERPDPEALGARARAALELALRLHAALDSSLRAVEAQIGALGSREGTDAKALAELGKKRRGLETQARALRRLAALAPALLGSDSQGRAGQGGDGATALVAAALALACDKSFSKRHGREIEALALALAAHEDADGECLGEIMAIDPGRGGLGFAEVQALRECCSTLVRRAVAEFFAGPFLTLPPALRNSLRALIASAAGSTGSLDETVAADLVYRRYASVASLHLFDAELRSLERLESGAAGYRDILLVGGKRRLDQFYGYVGELCIAQHVQEIQRRDFVPVRIVDETQGRLAGYIHFMVAKARLGQEEMRVALLAGIEPKSSWLAYVDELDFYLKARDAAIDWARALSCRALALTSNVVALSNASALAQVLRIDMEGKPVLEAEGPSFPQGYWNLAPFRLLWIDSALRERVRPRGT